MVATQRGVLLREANQGIVVGSVTTGTAGFGVIDTNTDFIALGVQVGDVCIMLSGANDGLRQTVQQVFQNEVDFIGFPSAIAIGNRYQIIRPPFVLLNGTIRIRHEHRIPLQSIPGAAGDRQQPLNRKSRQGEMQHGVIYRGDVASTSRDAAHVSDAQQLRAWSDAGTILRLDTLTEALLPVRITKLDVEEEAGAKGFPIGIEVVEVV